MTMMLPIVVDREEAARALRCSAADVDDLVVDGRLPALDLFGDHQPRFRPEDLLRLVDAASAAPATNVDQALRPGGTA